MPVNSHHCVFSFSLSTLRSSATAEDGRPSVYLPEYLPVFLLSYKHNSNRLKPAFSKALFGESVYSSIDYDEHTLLGIVRAL